MISILAEGFNLLAIIIYKVFLLASFVGKLIVAVITGISGAAVNFFDNLIIFLQILYEDNASLFSEEIPNIFNDAIESFGNHLSNVQNGTGKVYHVAIEKFGGAVGAVKYFVDSVVLILSETLFLLKDTTVFLGNALWLILTFIPVQLPQLLKVGFQCVKNVLVDIIVDTYMVLLKCTNFMTDVPLESFIGIISAILIVRLCVHFRAAILSRIVEMYWLLIRKCLYWYYTLYNYVTDSEVRVITNMAIGQDIAAGEPNSASENDDVSGADALCIICQERQKCVLTLPCRHVCLCTECCRRLYGYQRTCPICRTFIYHSVTVYL